MVMPADEDLITSDARCAVIVSDNDGHIRAWNCQAAEVFGYATDEILGRPESDLFTPEDCAAGLVERDRAWAARDGGMLAVRWYVHKDGGRLWADATLVPLPGPDGRQAGFVRVLHDETHSRLLQEQIARRDARLVDADRRKDLFLATLAHEIKNPLLSIRMGLSLLRESRGSEEEFDEWSDLVEGQVDAISRIVGDLSDAAGIAAGKVELRRERLSARDVMENSIASLLGVLEAGGRRLATAFPPDDAVLVGDPHRLRQVFANLLSNAAQHTSEAGRIEFAAVIEGDELVFRVQDDGAGISPEKLPHVFELYYQVDARGSGGLGLGLALVRRLVALHGGTVEARSAGLGHGCEFVVRIPCTDSPPVRV